MVPDRNPCCIHLEIRYQPVSRPQKLLAPLVCLVTSVKVVIPQSILGDRNRIVLLPDVPPIVQERDPRMIVRTSIIRLLAEVLVIPSQPDTECSIIELRM